jgi:hypothetical protein
MEDSAETCAAFESQGWQRRPLKHITPGDASVGHGSFTLFRDKRSLRNHRRASTQQDPLRKKGFFTIEAEYLRRSMMTAIRRHER